MNVISSEKIIKSKFNNIKNAYKIYIIATIPSRLGCDKRLTLKGNNTSFNSVILHHNCLPYQTKRTHFVLGFNLCSGRIDRFMPPSGTLA